MSNEEKQTKKCDCCGNEDLYIYLVRTPSGSYCLNCVDMIMEDCDNTYYL